jgi:acetyltransferase-like isoleucine patch superfamily enzyme
MAFISTRKLRQMGFAHLGRDIKVSTRAAIYEPEKISIGDFSRIDDFCVVSGKVTIGRNVHVSVFANLAGSAAGIEIGDFVAISYATQVFAQSDDYTGEALTGSTVPDRFTKPFKAPVVIGRHAIVGAGSIIFPGVTVAEGCAVGAHSTVMSSTKPWGIYVGTPARFLRARKQDLLILEQEYLKATGSTARSRA